MDEDHDCQEHGEGGERWKGVTALAEAGSVSAEGIERRRWPRRTIDLPLTLCPSVDGVYTEGIPGRTVDVGVGGLCVETLRPVGGKGELKVILSLSDGHTIVAAASIVGAEDLGDGWRYRLAFEDLDHHHASRLAELTLPAG